MNMDKDNRINEIMNSLEGIQRAKAPRDGFAKIEQALSEKNRQLTPLGPSTPNWIKVAAVVALLICPNIWAASSFFKSFTSSNTTNDAYPQLINDFNLYAYE
ncbi:hypothetical protein BFP72_05660 [Reichenbachiella sp. 5M10]|uniref:Uncharacterized protein n=1 Tax=Reichenbachiella agariperforans TaxID=156994 RepID=A0A1M6LXN1_REIAG|nr:MULTISPECIES: hypothetical protein [Reichenbachiella]PIB34916.1 hypothetical protein BFP72_05660 [Reichenbachiella sp. 5M10]SHJ75936.1 hypothetical protein SAMN04488028_1011135 [Reichenbachiella agariperforans]